MLSMGSECMQQNSMPEFFICLIPQAIRLPSGRRRKEVSAFTYDTKLFAEQVSQSQVITSLSDRISLDCRVLSTQLPAAGLHHTRLVPQSPVSRHSLPEDPAWLLLAAACLIGLVRLKRNFTKS